MAVGDKLYLIGGLSGEPAVPGRFPAVSRVDVYDPSTGQWTQRRDAPEAFSHAPAVFDGKRIWFIGGYVGDHPGPGTATIWRYKPRNDTWSRGPDLPEPRGAGAAALVGRNIHYFGGMNEARSEDQNDHWVLNTRRPRAGWKQAPELPQARNHVTAAAIGSDVYVIGGQLDQEENQIAFSRVDVYDTISSTWSSGVELPQPRSHVTAATVVDDGSIIFAGGESGFGTEARHDEVFAWRPGEASWRQIATLPAVRSTSVAGVIEESLYVATGNGEGSGGGTITIWAAALT